MKNKLISLLEKVSTLIELDTKNRINNLKGQAETLIKSVQHQQTLKKRIEKINPTIILKKREEELLKLYKAWEDEYK